ncbi:MAG: hypothetical protein AAF191_03565 [Verrucomicrobiota bacterium]
MMEGLFQTMAEQPEAVPPQLGYRLRQWAETEGTTATDAEWNEEVRKWAKEDGELYSLILGHSPNSSKAPGAEGQVPGEGATSDLRAELTNALVSRFPKEEDSADSTEAGEKEGSPGLWGRVWEVLFPHRSA